jgi:hypothetical protein
VIGVAEKFLAAIEEILQLSDRRSRRADGRSSPHM